MKYDHRQLEKKWQDRWDAEHAFEAKNDYTKPKYYTLVEFPYPSGQGLHIGHPRPYTALDIVSRKKRMQGYNVLFPMGWDAFGLPTENYAIKHKIHPATVTKNNVKRFKEQLKSIGFSFDILFIGQKAIYNDGSIEKVSAGRGCSACDIRSSARTAAVRNIKMQSLFRRF